MLYGYVREVCGNMAAVDMLDLADSGIEDDLIPKDWLRSMKIVVVMHVGSYVGDCRYRNSRSMTLLLVLVVVR